MGSKARIVFMGTPAFATASLRALYEAGHEIVGVVTVPDKPAGRGLQLQESDVKQFAREKGLLIMQPEKLKNPDFIKQISDLNADIFVVVAFRKLPVEVWRIPPKGTFNLHASLLPRFRGAAPIQHAVISGETVTGVTTFLIDEQIDTGNILVRKEEPIYPSDTAGTLHDRLMVLGASTVVETTDLLMSGKAEMKSQDALLREGEELPEAPKIHRTFCRLDPNEPAVKLERKILGLNPFPGAWLVLDDGTQEKKEIKVFSAEVLQEDNGSIGTIVTDGKGYFGFQTTKYTLLIKELQSPGKKKLGVKEWLTGVRSGFLDWRVL
jgi:methionyl-tRNA formyltransferase